MSGACVCSCQKPIEAVIFVGFGGFGLFFFIVGFFGVCWFVCLGFCLGFSLFLVIVCKETIISRMKIQTKLLQKSCRGFILLSFKGSIKKNLKITVASKTNSTY